MYVIQMFFQATLLHREACTWDWRGKLEACQTIQSPACRVSLRTYYAPCLRANNYNSDRVCNESRLMPLRTSTSWYKKPCIVAGKRNTELYIHVIALQTSTTMFICTVRPPPMVESTNQLKSLSGKSMSTRDNNKSIFLHRFSSQHTSQSR